MRNFEELEVWKRSCRLALQIYEALKKCRDHGFYNQITRAAVSVPSNIAEGSERRTDREFISFLYIAKGSVGELRTQLYLAAKLGYITSEQMTVLAAEAKEISKMLHGLISSVS